MSGIYIYFIWHLDIGKHRKKSNLFFFFFEKTRYDVMIHVFFQNEKLPEEMSQATVDMVGSTLDRLHLLVFISFSFE